jgi:penicillin G amidase
MKILRKIFYSFIVLLLSGIVVVLIYLASQKPHYNGSIKMPGLSNEVEVIYDYYGVPHIYAESETDAYFALGFVHAQDRLFQMEMTKRVASGQLSEILGADFIKVDAFFKTLGFQEHANAAAKLFMSEESLPYQKAAKAYLKGINHFINSGSTPVEFVMLGIDKKEFTVSDLYLSSEYMAFNFAMAFRTDPLMSFIQQKLGSAYFKDIITAHLDSTLVIPNYFALSDSSKLPIDSIRNNKLSGLNTVNTVLDRIPVSPFTGSNGWVIAPAKSHSGKVLFGNDTHIGFSQPSVWYEAHLEYPGFSFYGNFLAGFPFAAIGHTREMVWGLTMLENDDLDFYSERLKPGDTTKYWSDGRWKDLKLVKNVIKVKGEEDVTLTVMSSRHGPLVHHVMPEWKQVTENAVSMWWTHLKFTNNLMQVTYELNHAKNMSEFQHGVSQLISPGLNVMYGDRDGNIAWWAAGRLMKRAHGVNPVLLLDGSKYNLDPTGYLDFASNPQSVNPPSGFVYSANNQPDSAAGQGFYPGYYTPDDRAVRINKLFEEKNIFSLEDLHRISLDVRSLATPKVAALILNSIRSEVKQRSAAHTNASKILLMWDGEHQLRNQAPTIYYKLLYYVLQMAMEDELGAENFKLLLSTHALKNSVLSFVQNDSSVWWNDVNTIDVKESRNIIFEKAFDKTVADLVAQLGKNTDTWEWGRVHMLEHKHPIGMKKPFNLMFNVGPFPVPGGQEVINQMGFDLNPEGVYRVKYGPAMRIVLDMADVESSKSVLPTGQSGNVMSRYYNDQSNMYNSGKMRKQKMNRAEIESNRSGRLILEPGK